MTGGGWHAGGVSNLERAPRAIELAPGVVGAVDVVEARKAAIGDGTEVRRLLPQRQLRTIGAWCFLDHYGPDDVSSGPGMRVPPHPHIGLQTASWLFDGLVLHRDSLGSTQLIRPGELNLMTSGRAIAHSEESPSGDRPAKLHGVQLWIALPDAERHRDPWFAHHADLPVIERDGATITVIVGEHAGERSPATVYTPLVGLEVKARDCVITLDPGFEHGVLAADGPATVAGATISPGELAHLPTGLSSVRLTAPEQRRFLIVGGAPLGERLVMWWNFVARTNDEIERARAEWVAGGFGEVAGYDGDPLPAPPLPPTPLKPR
jgi:quercetin 2,3-dioxygenase